jgi:hypothetical protein
MPAIWAGAGRGNAHREMPFMYAGAGEDMGDMETIRIDSESRWPTPRKRCSPACDTADAIKVRPNRDPDATGASGASGEEYPRRRRIRLVA